MKHRNSLYTYQEYLPSSEEFISGQIIITVVSSGVVKEIGSTTLTV